jgi:polypeptide N-acetylgalactosaminyltransferase
MLGCAFAIRKDFFSDLGQYDEGLQIWNGEQIELSLKLHLCGGDLLEIPCSRLCHTFRSHQKNHQLDGVDVAARNFKRVAEVWLDEYKEVLYSADPERFGNVDAGDLTKATLVHEKLNCKPFGYFLERIAPEMYTRYFYQAKFPGFFAWGAIR